ncbi:MAG: hypothetical protein Q8N55_04460 [bacterium]|nr:hypothetical protein [bacterium]
MQKKILIITLMIIVSIFAGLFYLFTKHDNENVTKTFKTFNKPLVSWQKITITEEKKNIYISITLPRIIIPSDYNLKGKVNKEITQYIELLKDDFIFSVNAVAEDNGETNALNIDTEILLSTPHLISLAFTTTMRMAGVKNNDPERTFLVFDLMNGKLILDGNELFRDDLAWSKAVEAMKLLLLSKYQETPNCDLFFAPKHDGFSASCIGIDWNRGGEHLSIMGDIPISMIQELLTPSVLSDIVQ